MRTSTRWTLGNVAWRLVATVAIVAVVVVAGFSPLAAPFATMLASPVLYLRWFDE
jgi:hypothetical protein